MAPWRVAPQRDAPPRWVHSGLQAAHAFFVSFVSLWFELSFVCRPGASVVKTDGGTEDTEVTKEGFFLNREWTLMDANCCRGEPRPGP